MKSFRKPTGLCRTCGKPTRLLIHQGCGPKDSAPKDLRNRATAKKNYTRGFVPAFARIGQ